MKTKPKILCLRERESAVFNYRMMRPLEVGMGASHKGCLMRKTSSFTIEQLAKNFKKIGDIWVFKYIDDRHTLDILYTMRDCAKAKIVVDIDDNIWEMHFGNPAMGTPKQMINRSILVAESIRCADWVTVSTEPLRRKLLPLNSNVAVLENYIDPKDWKAVRQPNKKLRIGWIWSPTHLPDMKVIQEALQEINDKHNVEICIMGNDKNIFPFDTVNIPPVKYDKFPQELMRANFDISIAPLEDNQFNQCKSNIKFLESTMAGAAFIGSNVAPYRMIEHGKTGFLASSKEEWVDCITKLIKSKKLRKKMWWDARDYVLKNYSKGDNWFNFYSSI